MAPECHPQLCAFEQINVSQMCWKWHAVICSRAADSGWLLGIRDSIRLINKRRIPEEQCFNYQLLENNQLPPGKASSFFFSFFRCVCVGRVLLLFETGFLCVVLAVLELTCQPLPVCWDSGCVPPCLATCWKTLKR